MNDDRSHVVAAILAIALFAAFVGGLAVAVLWYATADAADYATARARLERALEPYTVAGAIALIRDCGSFDALLLMNEAQRAEWITAQLPVCMKEMD